MHRDALTLILACGRAMPSPSVDSGPTDTTRPYDVRSNDALHRYVVGSNEETTDENQ